MALGDLGRNHELVVPPIKARYGLISLFSIFLILLFFGLFDHRKFQYDQVH
jgi:hypothetical protein